MTTAIKYNLSELTFFDLTEANSATPHHPSDEYGQINPMEVINYDVSGHRKLPKEWLEKLESKMTAEREKVLYSITPRRRLYTYRLFYLPEKYKITMPSGEQVLPNETTMLVTSPIHPVYALLSGMLYFAGDLKNVFLANRPNVDSWGRCWLACVKFKETIDPGTYDVLEGWESVDKEFREVLIGAPEGNDKQKITNTE
ncbi:hypothetical protein CVT24_007711 [Panaeolus cyanescens]|uniref:Uncharacterized protein n=1 Tax=Panaeolus cyanescens TaxID=181874 RepID=A0A409YKQ3_9AGAR|nr:hypothetical protein CVT24_007711 [Panaeolus cyanescens]